MRWIFTCVIFLLCIYFGYIQGKPQRLIQGPCEQIREEAAYMVWHDGCMVGMSQTFMAMGNEVHPFPISDACGQIFKILRD